MTCMLGCLYYSTDHSTLFIYFQYFFSLCLALNLNYCDFSHWFSSSVTNLTYYIFHFIYFSSLEVPFGSTLYLPFLSQVFLYLLENMESIYKSCFNIFVFSFYHVCHFWDWFYRLTFLLFMDIFPLLCIPGNFFYWMPDIANFILLVLAFVEFPQLVLDCVLL